MSTQLMTKKTTYLTFYLGKEMYAVNVLKIREVLELSKITQVPKMPVFMRGVINVRGNVIPVVDLKLKFGMPCVEDTIDTCIVVIEIPAGEQVIVLGCLADSVEEVIELEPEQVEPAPQIGAAVNTEFIEGIGKRDGSFILILDMDNVFSRKDIENVNNSGRKSEKYAGIKE